MSITEMFIRTTVGFITLYCLCRMLNQKLIAQMTFFDFVAGITIGSVVASSFMTGTLPLPMAIFGIVLFCAYTFLSNLAAIKSFRIRKLLEGEPTHLIEQGRILEQGLKKVRLTIDSLLANLRKMGYFYLDQIEAAVMETDGTISVLVKPQHLPLTQKDIHSIQPSRGYAQAFIIDGKILPNTLNTLGKDMDWVSSMLQAYRISSIHEVVIAQIDSLGHVYIDTRDDPAATH